jgi:hypothetical protein
MRCLSQVFGDWEEVSKHGYLGGDGKMSSRTDTRIRHTGKCAGWPKAESP